MKKTKTNDLAPIMETTIDAWMNSLDIENLGPKTLDKDLFKLCQQICDDVDRFCEPFDHPGVLYNKMHFKFSIYSEMSKMVEALMDIMEKYKGIISSEGLTLFFKGCEGFGVVKGNFTHNAACFQSHISKIK